MRTIHILPLALIVSRATANVAGFIFAENGIILEYCDALPDGRSQVIQNNEPEPRNQQ